MATKIKIKEDVSDVEITSLQEGDILVARSGVLKNEPPTEGHSPVTVVDSSTVDLTLTDQTLSASVITSGIKLDDLGTPDDNTDLNVSTTAHGLTPKLPNDSTKYLNGVGSWATVPPSHDPVTVTDSSTVDFTLTGQNITAGVLAGGIKLDDLGTPDDNTDLNASATAHGLLPKLPNDATKVLKGDGTWGTSSSSGHVIESNEIDMASRGSLDFVGFNVTDDSANDRTKVALPDSFSALTGSVATKSKRQTRTVLYDNTLAVDTASWDIQNIDQSYDHLEIYLWGQIVTASNGANVIARFNNDQTDANYSNLRHYFGNSHGSSWSASGSVLAIFQGTTEVGTFAGSLFSTIQNYSKTTWEKSIVSRASRYDNTSPWDEQFDVRWKNTAAINRIQIQQSGTNFKAGSRLQIIGIKEESVITDITGTITPGSSYESQAYVGTQLFNQTFSVNTAAVEVNIPTGYDRIEISYYGRSTHSASTEDWVYMELNGDTTAANYYYSIHRATDQWSGSGKVAGIISNNNATGYAQGRIIIENPDSQLAHGWRSISNALVQGVAQFVVDVATSWQASAITKIKLFPSDGSWMAGSSVTVLAFKNQVIGSTGGAGASATGEVLYGKRLIYDNTLTAEGIFDVQNIPQGYDDLEFSLTARGTNAATYDLIKVAFNGDTTAANYHEHDMYNGQTVGGGQTANPYIGAMAAATSPANSFGLIKGTISNYASTTKLKNWLSHVETRYDTAAGYTQQRSGQWFSTNAINRITIQGNTAANFAVGSRLQVFGTKNMVTQVGQSTVYTGTQLFSKKFDANNLSNFVEFDVPAGYDKFSILVTGRVAVSATYDTIQFYLNNDTTLAHYGKVSHIGGSDHSVAAAWSDNMLGVLGGITDTVSNGQIESTFANYDNTAFYTKTGYGQDMEWANGVFNRVRQMGYLWNPGTTNAITHVKLYTNSTNNFVAGTSIVVIGYKNTLLASSTSYPAQVEVPIIYWSASSGSWARQPDSTYVPGYRILSGNVNTDYVEYPVLLRDGTWKIDLLTVVSTNRGILTFALDGVTVGTFDTYSAGTTQVIQTITGVVVSTAGLKTLRISTLSKNGSSTGYYAALYGVCFTKTG